MIINTTVGGGGSVGSLKTIAVSEIAYLPSSAKDGTIAVITRTTVPNTYVQNEQPTAQKNGDVWITTSGTSNAPIILGNITLYPTSMKQYNGSEWVSVSGYIRSNGEWLSLEMILFRNGNTYSEITGGWLENDRMDGRGNLQQGDIGRDITLYYKAEGSTTWVWDRCRTVNKIPAGMYSKLVIRYSISRYGNLYIGFGSDANSSTMDVQGSYGGAVYTDRTVELNLSSLDPSYAGYMIVESRSTGYHNDPCTCTIHEAYLTN